MRMKKSRELKILEQVAANNGVSVDEVKREIELAMSIALAAENTDEENVMRQKPELHGKPITPELFIRALSDEAKRRLQIHIAG